jgi:O-antigen/teichoic acid export membrane protein
MKNIIKVDKSNTKERHKRLANGISSAVIVKGLSAVISLWSLPLALSYLGVERYGVWITITTIVAWVSILDLGIADTLTNAIGEAYAFNDRLLARRQFSNALGATTAIAALAFIVLFCVLTSLDWVRILNVTSSQAQSEIFSTLLAGIVVVLAGLPANLLSKTLTGYQEVRVSNYITGLGSMIGLAGLFLGIHLRLGMALLLLLSVGSGTWIALIGLVWLVVIYKPWLFPTFEVMDKRAMIALLRSGSAFLMIHVAGIMAFGTDNLVVSHYLGAADVTPYAITWRLAGYAGVLQSLVFPALWPAYTEAFNKGEYGWLKKTLTCSVGASLTINTAMLAVLLIWGRQIIRHWAGPSAVPNQSLIVIVGLWNVIAGVMASQSNYLGAIGRNRKQGILSIIAAALNLCLSIFLVKTIGVIGVVLGTIISYLLVLVIPQTLIVIKSLNPTSSADI